VRHACLLALLAAVALALAPQSGTHEQYGAHAHSAGRAAMAHLLLRITTRRDATWHWQRVMHRPRTPYFGSVRPIRSIAYGRRVLGLWDRRAVAARAEALNPPHKREWLCIHRYEAWWTDPNGPYYGGLQMDLEFQAAYGRDMLRRKGTAENWTPLEQMWVAERAYRERGFWPWLNTATSCGLL
jgi:hypothetical protein